MMHSAALANITVGWLESVCFWTDQQYSVVMVGVDDIGLRVGLQPKMILCSSCSGYVMMMQTYITMSIICSFFLLLLLLLLLARLMGEYCFAVWRLSSSVTLPAGRLAGRRERGNAAWECCRRLGGQHAAAAAAIFSEVSSDSLRLFVTVLLRDCHGLPVPLQNHFTSCHL